MKSIDTRNQPILSFRRTVRITTDGIRYRLFRSAITVAVVAVAIAFLMNIFSESLIKTAIVRQTREDIRRMRLAATWESRITRPDTDEQILRKLVQADAEGNAYRREAAGMSGAGEAEMRMRAIEAGEAVAYLDFLESLNSGQRRRLVGSANGRDVFDRLQAVSEMERFVAELRLMKSIRMPDGVGRFVEFLKTWPGLKQFLARVREGQAAAIAKLNPFIQDRTIEAVLGDVLFAKAAGEAGFMLDEGTTAEVRAQITQAQQAGALEKTLKDPKIRQAMARRFDILPADITTEMMWKVLTDRDGASWYFTNLRENNLLSAMSVEEGVAVSRAKSRQRLLMRAEWRVGDVRGGLMGMGRQMTWLVFVSMIVCVVGICNAMLMSVTERFREIATLKCLGALDGFIMLMFVLEACFFGVVGGFAGAIAGSLIGSVRMMQVFGSELVLKVFEVSPGALPLAMLAATGMGIVLAAVAAVYPSFKAARLAPMEAMRIE